MRSAPESVRAEIRGRYERVASMLIDEASGTVASDPVSLESGDEFGSALYSRAEQEALPRAALAASLGCGSPTTGAGLRPGDLVLDLGCGGGIDALLAARAVGRSGLVVGLDLTSGMLGLARANAHRARVHNVGLVAATMEVLPFRRGTFDMVISNCSVNLAGDKAAVFAEAGRVLRRGRRLHLCDVVADDSLTVAERLDRSHQTGCTVARSLVRSTLTGWRVLDSPASVWSSGIVSPTRWLLLLSPAGFGTSRGLAASHLPAGSYRYGGDPRY